MLTAITMATPHISSLNPDAQEGAASCPALGTGLEFAELKGYMSNSAGKMGFFRFNFWSLSNCIAFFNQPFQNLESGLEKDIFKFKKTKPCFSFCLFRQKIKTK